MIATLIRKTAPATKIDEIEMEVDGASEINTRGVKYDP